jgi:hypothetical protein
VPAPETHIAKPAPQQLFELAGLCIELGKGEKNRLAMRKKSTVTELSSQRNAVVFMTDFLAPHDQRWYDFIFDPDISLSRQLMGSIHIARDKAWAMQIKQTGLVFEGDQVIDKYQDTHKFRWMGGEVLQASRVVQFADLEEDYGESFQPENYDLDNYMLDINFLGIVSQYAEVSEADCARLMGDIRDFADDLIEQQELHSQ